MTNKDVKMNKERIQKIKNSLPKKFYFDKSFESPDRNKILVDIELCYKKVEHNNILNCSPLLSKDQEYHLFRKLNYLKYRLLKKTIGFKVSDEDLHPKPCAATNLDRLKNAALCELENLIYKIEETRNIILKSNTRLVFKRVHRYHPIDSFERDEFFSNGYCHILRAIDSFDFRRGFKFSTYCVRVLQTNISRDYRLSKERENKLATIDFPIQDKKEISYSSINTKYNKNFIKEILFSLKENKRILQPELKIKILIDYYGINNNGQGKKLREIAQELNLSKERIRQIKFDTIKYLGKHSLAYDPLC
jgi:RNA polymerase sigma factor (sigma-70 family)